jgi:metal-responsive CopG/Arc/MetJ family transcriptional regulator
MAGRYDDAMKVTLSIPDDVFEATEKVILQWGLSRSAFYTQAVQKMLKQIEDEAMTEHYNRVYSSFDTSLDPEMRAHVNRMLARIEWDETAETSKNLEEKS